MPDAPSILYLTDADVQQTLSVSTAVDLAEKGIIADAADQVAGDKFYMPVAEAGFIKPFSGYLLGEKLAFVKTFSFFPENPVRFSSPTTSSMVLLFDAENGLPVCLMAGGWVTALKTGASTAVTASRLARPDSEVVTIFGAGMQGRMHLQALVHRLPVCHAYVIDVLPEAATAYAQELGPQLGIPIESVELSDRESAVRHSDIVITVTTGDQALVQHAWLRPGVFVARLGTYQEVALDVITKADKLVVDNWRYVSPRVPELKSLIRQDRIGENRIHATWPDIVAGRRPGRESNQEIIVYIALGIWGEYAAILPQVYSRALALGLGTRLPAP